MAIVTAGRVRVAPDAEVWVRGWLHGNVVKLHRSGSTRGAIDSGYCTGATETAHWLGELETLLLTHVHSDHAGGVAMLRSHNQVHVCAHPDANDLVTVWDPQALWLTGTGQQLPRFVVDRVLGADAVAGNRRFTVIDTPGHAVGGVSFFDAEDGLLITGDALWEDGFGMLNPWFDPPGVFERAAGALDRLAAVPARIVVPGHGLPFTDVGGAVDRARRRLDHYARHPDRLRRHVLKNTAAFHALSGAPRAEVAATLVTLADLLPPLPGDAAPCPVPELLAALSRQSFSE